MLLATHDYLGSIEYKGSELEAIYHDEGRVYYEEGTGRYEFNIQDHLGNTRLTFTDKDNDDIIEVSSNPATNEILQENHYYPFGMNMNGQWMANPGREDKYQYNGKELNEDFGLDWYDYGARWYMPDIGRFGSVDPLAEKMTSWSQFNYSFNNPIRFIDPNGAAPNDIVVPKNDKNTENYRAAVLGYLKTLTNDELKWSGNKVVIAEKDAANKDKNLSEGTQLLRNLIENTDKEITILKTDGGNWTQSGDGKFLNEEGTPGVGSASKVYFNEEREGNTISNVDGTTGVSVNIGLAHELIHAWTNANGLNDGGKAAGFYDFDLNDDGKHLGFHDRITRDEVNVRKKENEIRKQMQEVLRAVPINISLIGRNLSN
ncbi:MAG: hypothetical protein IPJ74_08555 [Saprospiraceae bacterium]|nr:hypothetical protein [Saprospiraceae bacterium]